MSIESRRATSPTARVFQERPHTVGFVSLGCAKALVDSERILTQLRAEGYEVTSTYAESDIVVVNTCGFINDAVEESLDAIADAVEQHDKVIVTGCLGARAEHIRDCFPDLLAVTGPHATQAVLDAVHEELPPRHDPFLSLLPPGGIKLTPRHYAYLKISEGCNHGCRFCIIPQLRGPLVSRPIDEVMDEAENLVRAGVRELLVVSQDTSAYGADIKYRPRFHRGSPLKTNLYDLAHGLGSLGGWVRL
ncbi:MAG: radical SAM protein, partial [Gammaproteobacteria bacterium]|nr:radical SAM protein [Gammaproteobacteria bacterium]